jgi:DNA polymerase gamma 1
MHSHTASTFGISRDQAKVMNYSRIYGASERFAKTLLMQFNHRLTEEEAGKKARQMYADTKGSSVYRLSSNGKQLAVGLGWSVANVVTSEELSAMKKAARKHEFLFGYSQMSTDDLVERKVWSGGTESHMFNKLEEIAQCEAPETPVLKVSTIVFVALDSS